MRALLLGLVLLGAGCGSDDTRPACERLHEGDACDPARDAPCPSPSCGAWYKCWTGGNRPPGTWLAEGPGCSDMHVPQDMTRPPTD